MEAALTPLMEQVGVTIPVCGCSACQCGSPQYGRHIELGVKGPWDLVPAGWTALLQGLHDIGADMGPELVQNLVVLAGFTACEPFWCNVLCASRRGCVHCATVVRD